MGYNTSMIILNDGLDQIKNDKDFGRKVYDATVSIDTAKWEHRKAGVPFHGIDIGSGYHGNCATVIETHHADATSVIAFGGNRGLILSPSLYAYGTDDEEVRIVRALADRLGYDLTKQHPIRKPVHNWDE